MLQEKSQEGLTRINAGLEKCLYLGNINAKRDWGHAKDYVYMQWLMLQQEKPEDFVISSGKMYTVTKIHRVVRIKAWMGSGKEGLMELFGKEKDRRGWKKS